MHGCEPCWRLNVEESPYSEWERVAAKKHSTRPMELSCCWQVFLVDLRIVDPLACGCMATGICRRSLGLHERQEEG